MAQWARSVASGEPFDAEFRMARGPTASSHHVRVRAAPRRDDDGAVLRWYGTIEDVHQQREAAERLRESEEMHRLTIELMGQIIWTTEPDGTGLVLSARYRELTGMSQDEEAELSIHPDDREAVVEAWGEAVASGQPFSIECRLRMADGKLSRLSRPRRAAARRGRADRPLARGQRRRAGPERGGTCAAGRRGALPARGDGDQRRDLGFAI